ncbi:hypothetical protein BD560DRAFT_437027 [Blakeslea trispora]|nr:hypothetical protein BD560DRAFT_437027 [Blakeslea trispora]
MGYNTYHKHKADIDLTNNNQINSHESMVKHGGQSQYYMIFKEEYYGHALFSHSLLKRDHFVSDKVKMANMMEVMLDRLALVDVLSPVVCCLYDDGKKTETCKIHMVDNSTYALVQLSAFRVIMPFFAQLKGIALDTMYKIELSVSEEVLPGPISLFAFPSSWLRPSFEYPVIVDDNKRIK